MEKKTWEQRKLGELGETYSGLAGKTKEDFNHGDGKFITYMNVYSNTIARAEGVQRVEIDHKQSQVKYGDILFTISSETPQEVAMSSVWLFESENTYLNSFCFGYSFKNKPGSFYYWGYYLRSPKLRHHFSVLAQGISRYNISKNKVLGTDVDIPKSAEQRKIGTAFKKLDDLIAANEYNHKNALNIRVRFYPCIFT
ncbi:restriction endonuclease subunit S [Lactiplantibacillus pentosus]|uniref:restriction endonuclease subunit S n=1 Tax=Lactiplantibacillus pentosus TaxID=1589 RepID=UPI001CFF698F|nr:restriction endonuclease subunit S [Lactiplantibacillus pentosus]MCB5221745.1 restriction endonuclease subunit S [Lactiplantibacillus pentosus]